jgi:hypothetical protein
VRFGNSIAEGTGNAVARHISVGLGAYLALLASGYLAVRGLRVFRATAPPRLNQRRGWSSERR